MDDLEEQVFKLLTDVADLMERVPKLEKSLKRAKAPANTTLRSLQNSIGRVKTRVQNIENLALQEQVWNLSKKVEEANNRTLEACRVLADFEMDFTQMHMKQCISDNASWTEAEQLRESVSGRFGQARQAAKQSTDPLGVSVAFRKWCMQVSNDNGLKAFG